VLVAIVAAVVIAVVTAILASRAAAAEASKEARRAIDEARAQAAAQVKAAELEAAAATLAAETDARAAALDARSKADDAVASEEARVDQRGRELEERESEVARLHDALDVREAALDSVHRDVQARRDRANGVENDAKRKHAQLRTELEQRAGTKATEIVDRLGAAWLDDARARAAAMVRAVDQTAADPAHDREAKRVMEIASTRYHHHYLTERAQNFLRVGKDIVEILLDNNSALHTAVQRVAGVQLLVSDEKDAIRLDGLDGVGKEFVRRAMNKLLKKPEMIDDARKDPDAWATKGRDHLDQEIRALGKRAFQTLGIQKAHPEIVELVGALNFRTSYTQNQWWHAVESAYLAGMMAAELGLDTKLARRATLMHDIGKALTH
jgi:ribonuclease Y